MKKKWIIIVIAALLAIAAFAVVLIVNQNNTPPEDTDTTSIIDNCWEYVTDMNIVEQKSETVKVTLKAPDYVSLVKILIEENNSEITDEDMAKAIENNPEKIKEYTFIAASDSENDIETALKKQISYELMPIAIENSAVNTKYLYNKLANNPINIENNSDPSHSDTNLTLVLSGIEADSIQYYDCAESGNFAVIEKDGKYGIIGYDGNMILPIEYISIYQGRAHSYDYLVVFKNKDDWLRIDKDGNIMHGYPDGGDVDPDAYWYNGQLAVFMLGEGIIGGIDELSWVAIEQRHWEENAVLPIQEMTGIVENEWGIAIPKIDNTSFALLDVTTGQLVSDFVYSGFDTGNGFREGVLAVKKGDKWGFIDTKGNEITDFLYDPYKQEHSYDGIEYQYSIFTAVNGYIAVLKNGKWGLIDTQGNTVVEPTYDGISQVNPDGMFWLKENGTWSLYQLGTA